MKPLLPETSRGWTRGTVPLSIAGEITEVEGWVKGEWGVSKGPDGTGSPRLTHLETGFKVWCGGTVLCKRLADALTPYVSTLTSAPSEKRDEELVVVKSLIREAYRLDAEGS